MKTYEIEFNGTHEAVEHAIRKFDQIFRRRYNVYGGKRIASGKSPEGYHVIMTYTADWNDYGGLFPEFSFEVMLRKQFEYETSGVEWYMDFWYEYHQR